MPDNATVAITSNLHMKAKMTTPIVHPNGGTGMGYPSEETFTQQKTPPGNTVLPKAGTISYFISLQW